jgi:hypothetical protein
MTKSKTAVMLVHGQGEQRSMEMGLSFAEHVMQANFRTDTEKSKIRRDIVTVPEKQTGIESQRRIEIRPSNDDPDFDIFEFYWAPSLNNSTIRHFNIWFFGLLRRQYSDIPKRARFFYRFIKVLIWSLLPVTAFFIYTTILSMLPVQIIQIAIHGWGAIVKFSLDWRLIFSVALCIFFVLSTICLSLRRYQWGLGFLSLIILGCMLSPFAANAEEQIREDVDWLSNYGEPPFDYNIWGARIVTVRADKRVAQPGAILEIAASASRRLCGDREDGDTGIGDPEIAEARRTIDVGSEGAYLNWNDMEPNRGVQLKDICLIPVTLASPVLYARVADSAHTLTSGLLFLILVLMYSTWSTIARPFLVNVMSDSARYLNNHPANNFERDLIRQNGIKMIDALHKCDRYDNIIVVAHSLGSVVAFDILRHYWGQVSDSLKIQGQLKVDAFDAANRLIDAEDRSKALEEWREAQSSVFTALGGSWRVSDFVTLGSPLAHGRLLLEGSGQSVAESERFYTQRNVTMSVPACPPVRTDVQLPHLGAADIFLAVRWTNMFFDDDFVGGTVARDPDGLLFGDGIKDLKFSPKRLAAPGLSHNSYWLSCIPPDESDGVPWLEALRSVLGLQSKMQVTANS